MKTIKILADNFVNKNEELMFNELADQIETIRKSKAPQDFWLLIGNINLNAGATADVLLFRSNAVTVIELKNYDGELFPSHNQMPANGQWNIVTKEGTSLHVKGHNAASNPFIPKVLRSSVFW